MYLSFLLTVCALYAILSPCTQEGQRKQPLDISSQPAYNSQLFHKQAGALFFPLRDESVSILAHTCRALCCKKTAGTPQEGKAVVSNVR